MTRILRPFLLLALRFAIVGVVPVLALADASADGLNVASSSATVVPAAAGALRSGDSMPTADRVVVHKGDRRMVLMRGDDILRTYKIALGLNPVGHKERSGDFRTPEGLYYLTRRNPRSDFFLSIQVSYPNQSDMKNAKRNGWDTGGSIMIHGLPNQLKHTPTYYESRDWTDGCIAVSNSDMLEIWLLTANNIPIEILP